MGSGLIWAGVGKGIADAGATYGNMMFKAAESELADQRSLLKAQALKRFEEDLKEEAAKRDADIYSRAQTRAGEIATTRQAQQLETDSSKLAANTQNIAGEAPAMTQDEMKRHLESLNPAERKALEGTGLVSKAMSPMRQELQGYDDTITAARELGGSSTLVKSLQDAKKERLAEIKAEFKEQGEKEERELNRQREDRRDRESRERYDQGERRLDILGRNADTNRIRAERPSGGGVKDLSEVKLNQEAETLRKSAKDATRKEDRIYYEDRLREVMDEIADRRKNKPSAETKGGDNSNVKSGPGTIPEPKSPAELSKLDPGTRYKAPDGTIRIKS